MNTAAPVGNGPAGHPRQINIIRWLNNCKLIAVRRTAPEGFGPESGKIGVRSLSLGLYRPPPGVRNFSSTFRISAMLFFSRRWFSSSSSPCFVPKVLLTASMKVWGLEAAAIICSKAPLDGGRVAECQLILFTPVAVRSIQT